MTDTLLIGVDRGDGDDIAVAVLVERRDGSIVVLDEARGQADIDRKMPTWEARGVGRKLEWSRFPATPPARRFS